ncbi:MAG: septation protein SepH, partial [Brachybacterium tyrofermentans]
MREIELDGIHDDGEHVILVDSDGERYTLRIDKALRAAVRTDRPALGMIQAADTAPLRPREIQTMLRSGRSAEDISEAADIPVDHVRRYEGPVLAEREWTAQRARTFPVGRGGPSLDDVVAERLAAREATEETAWDAWRRADGTWTLELTFSAAGRTRQAHWVAELDNRSVAPVDDEARWISDEDAPPEPTRGRARLQAVKSSVYDLEADGSFDEKASGPRRGRAPRAAQRSTTDDAPPPLDDGELDALNARRGLRSVPQPVDDSASVWTSLDEDVLDDARTDDAGRAEETGGTGDIDESGRTDAADDSAEPTGTESAGAEPTGTANAAFEEVADSDRDALLEHTTSEADLTDDAADADVTDRASDAAADGFRDADGLEAQDDADGTEDADFDATGDHASDAPTGSSAGSSTGGTVLDSRHFQDTVDLTPLPGFSAT